MRLVRQLAEYTISLKELEDNLLARLAASQARREWGWRWHAIWLGWCFPFHQGCWHSQSCTWT